MTKQVIYEVFSEWDIGLGKIAFTSKDRAWEHIAQTFLDHDIESEVEMSFKDCRDEGLIGLTEVDLYS